MAATVNERDGNTGRGRRVRGEAETRADSAGLRGRSASGSAGNRAFDQWLNRGLHTIFDDIANEPVPEDLLRLIEGDRFRAGEPDREH